MATTSSGSLGSDPAVTATPAVANTTPVAVPAPAVTTDTQKAVAPLTPVVASDVPVSPHVEHVSWLKQEALRIAAEFHKITHAGVIEVEKVVKDAEKIFSFLHTNTASEAAKLAADTKTEVSKL